jgi:NADH-quinone oxidoreductase subunit J
LSVDQVFFYLISAVVVGAALGTVISNNIVHAALFLVAALLSIAGIYVLLSAEFLALVQVLLYAGGVIVLMLFALMMTRGRDLPQQLSGAQRPFAVIGGGALAVTIAVAALGTNWRPNDDITAVPFQAIGESLFSTWAVPFEIASLVLLVALIGAIVLARQEGD